MVLSYKLFIIIVVLAVKVIRFMRDGKINALHELIILRKKKKLKSHALTRIRTWDL